MMAGVVAQAVRQVRAGLLNDDSTRVSARRSRSPGELACALDVRTVQTPALRLIDQVLVETSRTPDGRLIVSIAPQEGKSTRVSHYFPLWLLKDNPDLRICIASYADRLARRWGRAIRNSIKAHPELGLRVKADTHAANEWALEGHHGDTCSCRDCPRDDAEYTGGVITVGIGSAITGRPVDVLIIDDPVKDRAQAESEAYREAAWDWWTDTGGRTRFSVGAFCVVIQTRWHEDDLAGRLQTQDVDQWTVVNIPAQADHRPEKGETDPLGRQPGGFMTSARGDRIPQWTKIRDGTPSTWASLYQGRPAPEEGTLFKRTKWQWYNTPKYAIQPNGTFKVFGADEVVMSWDMAFKDTKASDWVVGQVWARYGPNMYLLTQVRGRWDFTTTCDKFEALVRDWPQARRKLVEDKANGTAVINVMKKKIPGIVEVTPTDGKWQRAVAVSPYVDGENVYLPEGPAWVQGFVDECATFPNSAYDDQVDAFTQAADDLLGNLRTVKVHRPPAQTRMPTGFGEAMGGSTWGTGRQFRR
jgi:predicted phage terminase large subunit-like protein